MKAAPNWSSKYKTYEICTAGISLSNGWRRLYPFPENTMIQQGIKIWDIIEVSTKEAKDDPRKESRKIEEKSIKVVGRIKTKKEKRSIIASLEEDCLENALNGKRSIALINPKIEGFKIKKTTKEPIQYTLEGKPFRKHPYSDVNLIYRWSCQKCCRYCDDRSHVTNCFDWGANYLFRKYKDEEEAKIKVRNKLHFEMKYDNDTWFILGTTRMRPWKRWMIIGLLWMKKDSKQKPKPLEKFIK